MILIHEEYSTFTYLTFDGFGVMRDKYTWVHVIEHFNFEKRYVQQYHMWDGKTHPPDYIKRKKI